MVKYLSFHNSSFALRKTFSFQKIPRNGRLLDSMVDFKAKNLMGIVTGIESKPMSMFLINDIYKSSHEFYLCAKESMEIDHRI